VSAESKTLQKYAQPLLISSIKTDDIIPFSYKQWIKNYQGTVIGQEFKQYNEYLLNWFKDKQQTVTTSKERLRLDYLTLLRQIQIFFSEQETENWFNNVDLDNEKELLLGIPYFAEKLKQISIYYQQLRQNIKEARLKYNRIGTEVPIIEQVQKNILSTFTKKADTITVPYTIWKNVPELSSVQKSLVVEVEELYDHQTYLDRSPTLPVSAYFDFSHPDYQNFLNSKNLSLTSTEWMYSLGTYSLTAFPSVIDDVETFVLLDADNSYFDYIQRIAEKYLGQNKFTSLSQAQSSIKQDFYNVNIDTGNNFFLWPGAPYDYQAEALPRYESISLKDLDFSINGTAGSTIENSDTIFVKTARGIEGAWLANEGLVYEPNNMEALLNASSKTAFKYPYPGFGLSGENIGWTGPSFKTDFEFFYLENETKQAILNEYWTSVIETTGALPVSINNSTLIENKAYPNENYEQADKIKIWAIPPNSSDTSYAGVIDEAWLYRINRTNISIGANSNNTIFWPYEKLNTSENFPTYYPEKVDDVCLTVPVSNLYLPFAAAGYEFEEADKIYKVNNYLDTINDATECCWLSSVVVTHPEKELFYSCQPSFQGTFSPNTYTKFVWDGPDNTDVRSVFTFSSHAPDCKYITTNNTTYEDFNLCTCRQILFMPFGHPGEDFTENNSLADYIIEGNYNTDNVDLTVIPLSSFCWFQTNSTIGWGDGKWVSRSTDFGNRFYLKNGQTYYYYRTGAKFDNKETVVYPELIVRHDHKTLTQNYGTKFIWAQGRINPETTNWEGFNSPSEMKISPGDILIYSRKDTRQFTLTSTLTALQYIQENRGSIWSNFDYLTINDDTLRGRQQKVFFAFPQETYIGYVDVVPPSQIPQLTTVLGTTAINNVIYQTVRYIEGSSVNVPSSVSAIKLAEIQAIDPTPTFDLYCIAPQADGTVTFTFEVSGIRTIPINTITVVTSSVTVTKDLSGQALANIRAVSVTPDSYSFCVVENTVTFNFQVTALASPELISEPLPTPPQVPISTNILGILQWEITDPLQQKSYYSNTNSLQFSPTLAGVYSVGVTAITSAVFPPQIQYNLTSILTGGNSFYYLNTGLYVFTNVPSITAIDTTIVIPVSTNYTTNRPGYVLEVPLEGWDYNTNRFFGYSIFQNYGAKPYWAKGYTEKDENTKFKALNSSGNVTRILDNHNIIKQPEFSNIVFTPGIYLEYNRNYPADLNWNQPLTVEKFIDNKSWRQIIIKDSSDIYNINAVPTLSVSNIIFENYIDNKPVEIYYNAIQPFIWSITAIPQDSFITYSSISSFLAFEAKTPWNNITNQHFPTVATTPGFENLYTEKTVGGFFTPKGLGASVYINQDYNIITNLSSNSLKEIFEDPFKTVLGRGLTRTEIPTPYSTEDNNIWLKEPTVVGPIAGTVNKSIFKKYQKFIPYQSKYETNPNAIIGITTPNSRQTPWGGINDLEWVDTLNYPISPTGELNINKWANSQQLKQLNLQLDYWCSDIFNNQYGLYKDIKNKKIFERNSISGQLWVRKNNQFVGPAVTVLSGVFDSYKNYNVYSQLTGSGITKIDVFYDTLMIQTTAAIFFEKIVYDYNTNTIFSTIDDARILSLPLPTTPNYNRELLGITLSGDIAVPGETWFFPQEKEVFISIGNLRSNITQSLKFLPELYQLDLNTQNFKKVFPINQNDLNTLNNLSSQFVQFIEIQPPTLSYNNLTKQFLFSVLATNTNNKNTLTEIYLNTVPNISIDKIVFYQPPTELKYPPIIEHSLFTSITLSPTSTNTALNFTCTPSNGSAIFRPVNLPSWVRLSTNGLFTGTPPNTTNIYNAEFTATNSTGPAYYNLIISVSS